MRETVTVKDRDAERVRGMDRGTYREKQNERDREIYIEIDTCIDTEANVETEGGV